MIPKRQLWILLSFGLVLVIVSFSATYMSMVYNYGPDASQPEESRGRFLPLLPSLDMKQVTRPGAVVVKKILYTKSMLEVEERSELPAELVGLPREELVLRLAKGIIERFSPEEIVIREIREELAPIHAAKRFLGVSNGQVAVFRGVPGLAYEVSEVTDIPINLLPPQEITDLRQGIPVYNDRNMMEVLMSLSSLAFAD